METVDLTALMDEALASLVPAEAPPVDDITQVRIIAGLYQQLGSAYALAGQLTEVLANASEHLALAEEVGEVVGRGGLGDPLPVE